jgi:hypothetical protein
MIIRAYEVNLGRDNSGAKYAVPGRLNHLNRPVIGILTPWPEEPAAALRNRP